MKDTHTAFHQLKDSNYRRRTKNVAMCAVLLCQLETFFATFGLNTGAHGFGDMISGDNWVEWPDVSRRPHADAAGCWYRFDCHAYRALTKLFLWESALNSNSRDHLRVHSLPSGTALLLIRQSSPA